jgi:hypothetical protein
MSDDEKRFEALRLAHELGGPTAIVVERAQAYYAFLIGMVSLDPTAQPPTPS